MQLVSETAVFDNPRSDPIYSARYPVLKDVKLWDHNAFTSGQPWAFYKKMREEAPVMWSDAGRKYAGFWSVTGYDDVKAVELNSEVFSSQLGSINMIAPQRKDWKHERLFEAAFNSLINLDAPHHMKVRIQQKDFFIPAYVAELSEKVAHKVDMLLDDLERHGPVVDFVKHFTEKLPVFTLCEMMGIDEADRARIIEWLHYLERAQNFQVAPLRTFLSVPSFPLQFGPKMNEMFAYGEAILADRRANPRHDLLSVIANSDLDGSPLSREFWDGSWLLIIFAGNDTTRNSLAGTMRLLTQFPDQKQRVLDDAEQLPNMLQEALRMTSPVIHMRRTATMDTELRGQKIAKGEKVILWFGAANRDPNIFPEPDLMDMSRDNVTRHFAFGHGPHKCLGSRVALMQMKIAYSKILERFPNIEWTGEQKIAPNGFVHAVSSMMVNLYGNGQK